MKPLPVQTKVEASTLPVRSDLSSKTISDTAQDIKKGEGTAESRIEHIWNRIWDTLGKAATVIVILWGGQGIYDRNFNQPETPSISKTVNDLKEKNKQLLERIKQFEEKVK